MSNKTLSFIRANQPTFTLIGSNLIAVEVGGNTRVITVDELAVLMTGQTVQQGRQSAYVGATVTPNYGVSTIGVGGAVGHVVFNAAAFDSNSFWSGGIPQRITIPANVTRARLSFRATAPSDTIGKVSIVKNGELPDGQATAVIASGICYVSTPALSVVGGDYFEVYLEFSSGTQSLYSSKAYFDIEALELTA